MDLAAEKEVLEQLDEEHKDECDGGAEDSDWESCYEGLEERFRWFPFSPWWDLRSAEPSVVTPRQAHCSDSPCRCPSTLADSVVQVLSLTIQDFSFSGYDSPNLFTGDAYVYGIAAVRDGVDLLRNYLFNHEEKDAQKISFRGGCAKLPMTLPRRTLTANMDMTFEYYLKIKAGPDDDPKEMVSGYDAWQPLRSLPGTIIAWETGKLGAVGTECAIMSDCVEARVSFRPLRLRPEGRKVRLAARLDFLDEHNLKLELYDGFMTLEEDTDGETFVIGVPLNDTLRLEFELDNGTREKEPCPFHPAFHGSHTKEHSLDRRTIFSITVSWSPVQVAPDYPLPKELE